MNEANQFGLSLWEGEERQLEVIIMVTRKLQGKFLEVGIGDMPAGLPLNVTEERLERAKSYYTAHHIGLTFAAIFNDFTVAEEALLDLEVEQVNGAWDMSQTREGGFAS